MEPLQCSTPPVEPPGPSPKSPPQTPPSPRNSPRPQDREKSASPTNERPPSPEPNCAICLGKSHNKSFTDSCLHQFCFTCLLEWSRVKAECPLCKQSFKSIIHNVRSNEDYDQYHLREADQRLQNPWMDTQSQRFRYSTTLTAQRRLERALQDLEHDLQRRFEPGDIIPPQRPWMGRRGLQPVDFRINVYNRNLWIRGLPSYGTYREISPRHYRTHPEAVHRLIPWLNRELQAIVRSPGMSTRVLDLIVAQLPVNHMCSSEFRTVLEPYLREHYDHFIHELQHFARSPYDLIGFDENAIYPDRPESMVDLVYEVYDSSDSDVVLLPQEENRPTRHIATSTSPVPGVSRTFLPIDQSSDTESSSSEVSTQDAETQVGGGPDSDDCIIVGYVKPRHERTPEIITLLSDTEVEEDVTEFPRVIEMDSYTFTTSACSSDSSDSEYVPSTVRRSQKKVHQKKKPTSTSTSSKKKSDHKASSSQTKSRDHSNSDASECSCPTRSSRRKTHSISSSSSSSSSSSDCGDTYSKTFKKGKWHVKINMPETWHNHSYDPPYTPSEINSYLASSSSSRPKLRSIVITRKPTEETKSSSGDRNRSSKSKSLKKMKSEPSTSRHRGGSHSSHSSRHRESSSSSTRHKSVKKEDKKRKHRKESSKIRLPKTKKRKRILSIYSDSSDD